ncbi:MAG: hypothetical protein ACP5QO_05900 [Clostridia bacterium]
MAGATLSVPEPRQVPVGKPVRRSIQDHFARVAAVTVEQRVQPEARLRPEVPSAMTGDVVSMTKSRMQ